MCKHPNKDDLCAQWFGGKGPRSALENSFYPVGHVLKCDRSDEEMFTVSMCRYYKKSYAATREHPGSYRESMGNVGFF